MMDKSQEESAPHTEKDADLSVNEKNGGVLYDEFVVSGERFSSDEEEEIVLNGEDKKTKTKGGRRKKSSPTKISATNVLTEENSMIVDGLHITDLSDNELYNKLNEYGVDVGPIVDSTRNIYRKKLAILMRGESNFNHSASPSKIENGNSEPFNNGKEEFSAGEEALELSEEINDEEPPESIPESIIRKISRRSTASSVKEVSRTATPRLLLNSSTNNISDVRPRISSSSNIKPDRFTPTPRRSIHSYRGNENEDSLRFRYRVSQNNSVPSRDDSNLPEQTTKSGTDNLSICSKFLRILPYFFLFLVFVATALYVYQNYAQKKEFSKLVDDTINWAQKTSDFIIEKISSPPIPAPSVKTDAPGKK